MMTERGVALDHSTLYRWVQRFAPEMEKRLRWQWRRARSGSWRVDDVQGPRAKWAYLYRAADKFGDTIDFYLCGIWNCGAGGDRRRTPAPNNIRRRPLAMGRSPLPAHY